jgi:predicted RNase H-like nuclease
MVLGRTLVGIDGCKAGWIAAIGSVSGGIAIKVEHSLERLVASCPDDALFAIDMPIGLPERITQLGRAPEAAARACLGQRRSSIFLMPSRQAVYAADYDEAKRIARMTSDPPRMPAIQAFHIFPRMRELDGLLRNRAGLAARFHETHPELAFWRMNGRKSLPEPKKRKNRPYEPGLLLRRHLLVAAGIAAETCMAAPPRGAGKDDLLDALACLVSARRIASGEALTFPDPPDCDAYGLPIAITV